MFFVRGQNPVAFVHVQDFAFSSRCMLSCSTWRTQANIYLCQFTLLTICRRRRFQSEIAPKKDRQSRIYVAQYKIVLLIRGRFFLRFMNLFQTALFILPEQCRHRIRAKRTKNAVAIVVSVRAIRIAHELLQAKHMQTN